MIQYEWWLLDMTLVLTGDIYGVHAILVVGLLLHICIPCPYIDSYTTYTYGHIHI
jgi:hypothetical protein